MLANHMEIKEMIKHRWNRRAKDFDKSPGHGIHSGREKEAWVNLLTRVLGKDQLEILDVGTGTGVIALVLAEMGHKVTGVDIAEEMVQKAREKAKNLNLFADFRVGDAEELPFADNSFDALINRHVVWSLPHPEKAMAEWKRVLRPGGKLIIIDSNWGNTAPLPKRLWCFGAQLLILVTERRNPWQSFAHRNMDKYLPMRQRKRPEADLEILRGLGFQVEVTKVDIPRWETFMGYLKYGYYSGEKFLLEAVKK